MASTESAATRAISVKVLSAQRFLPVSCGSRSGWSGSTSGGVRTAVMGLLRATPTSCSERRSTRLDLGQLGLGLVLQALGQRRVVDVRQEILATRQEVVEVRLEQGALPGIGLVLVHDHPSGGGDGVALRRRRVHG